MNRRHFLISIIVFLTVVAVLVTVYAVAEPLRGTSEVVYDDEGVVRIMSAEEQRAVYPDAVKKNGEYSSIEYNYSCSRRMTYSDSQITDTLTANVKSMGRGGEDPRYYGTFEASDASYIIAYAGGYAFSDESGEKYRSAMTEEEFARYLDSRRVVFDIEGFEKVEAVHRKEGGYTVSFTGGETLPEALTSGFFEEGVVNVTVTQFTGTANIDDMGRLTDEEYTVSLEGQREGKTVKAEINLSTAYSGFGERLAMETPEFEEYSEIGDVRAPLLMETAYESFFYRSYQADYNSSFLYGYSDEDDEYYIKLGYTSLVSQDKSFTASDTTTIDYNTSSNTTETLRTTAYEDGRYTVSDSDGDRTTQMDEDTARSTYYYMLLDHRPTSGDVDDAALTDLGESWGIDYWYTDQAARELCQTVLTTASGDQKGVAVNSEDYSISNSKGVMIIDKLTGALRSHEIHISAQFEGYLSVLFDHELNIEML